MALNLYAADNEDFFPDNRDGMDISWCGVRVQKFWENYLMKQVKGTVAAGGWYYSPTIPYSSHVVRGGEPKGSNFLFEDGSVRWYRSADVDPGSSTGSWICFYKIPIPQ